MNNLLHVAKFQKDVLFSDLVEQQMPWLQLLRLYEPQQEVG